MKKLSLLLFVAIVTSSLNAQTYTIVSRSNDTIKMFRNTLGDASSALKSMLPGSKSEAPEYRLIKKTYQGKESMIFVDFTKVLDKILVAYETDMITPGEWTMTTISFSDLYNAVTRRDAIYLSGEILGMKVEMFQRPPVIWEDLVRIDGIEFPLPLKLATYESDLVQKAAKEVGMEDANKAYIAYLIKAQLFNYLKYQKEIEEIYNMDEIMQLVRNTSEKELLKMSKGHSKELEKYRYNG